jgi:hypothetical protein
MNTPTTEAGKRTAESLRKLLPHMPLTWEGIDGRIAAIEAEARAEQQAFYSSLVAEAFDNGGRAALTALRERVTGLPLLWDANVPIGDDPWEACRERVLAEIDRALEK